MTAPILTAFGLSALAAALCLALAADAVRTVWRHRHRRSHK